MTPLDALRWFGVFCGCITMLGVIYTLWERRGELSKLFAELVLAAARLASHACWPRVQQYPLPPCNRTLKEWGWTPTDVAGTAEEIYGMSRRDK